MLCQTADPEKPLPVFLECIARPPIKILLQLFQNPVDCLDDRDPVFYDLSNDKQNKTFPCWCSPVTINQNMEFMMSKSIMITGASSGLGKALAYELAKKGHSLALTARSIEQLEEIRDDITKQGSAAKIVVRKLDVTDTDDVYAAVEELAEQLGGLDIMIANAGIAVAGPVGRGEFESAKQTIETNVIGAMATVDAAAAHFLAKGSGHLVGISSVAALRGMPRSSAYCASKAGFAMYLEAVRAELYKKKIDVTVLYPGYIDTPLNNTLKSRPFLIPVEKGASIIARLIEKKAKSATVPVFPWNIVGRLLKVLPTGIIAKM